MIKQSGFSQPQNLLKSMALELCTSKNPVGQLRESSCTARSTILSFKKKKQNLISDILELVILISSKYISSIKKYITWYKYLRTFPSRSKTLWVKNNSPTYPSEVAILFSNRFSYRFTNWNLLQFQNFPIQILFCLWLRSEQEFKVTYHKFTLHCNL